MDYKVYHTECIRQGGELMSRDGCLSPNSIGPDSPLACKLHFLLRYILMCYNTLQCANLKCTTQYTCISLILHWPASFTFYCAIATNCYLVLHSATHCNRIRRFSWFSIGLLHFLLRYCNKLLHTATAKLDSSWFSKRFACSTFYWTIHFFDILLDFTRVMDHFTTLKTQRYNF